MEEIIHTPVLLSEVLAVLNPKSGEIYIDATINGGGHARVIAERVGPQGRVVGIDWDCELIDRLKRRLQEWDLSNLDLICDNFANLRRSIMERSVGPIQGILFDLGFSSYHIERSGRGFSFQRDEPLDMRYSTHNHEHTAAEIINQWSEKAIADTLREYAKERFSRRIARAIVQARRIKEIKSSRQLAHIISASVPAIYRHGRLHPATRTFQALRIVVNHELENLSLALADSISLLVPGGRIAVITFHSLEDRIVKDFFRGQARVNTAEIITPKPIRPTLQEIHVNPRARSAHLRALQKLS